MDIPLKCSCGAVRGLAKDVSGPRGFRIVCYCDDCQAFAHYLGLAKQVLDDHGGTDIFQLTPAQLSFTKGTEHLKCLRLSDKGMIRWYAGCCKTPIANSMAAPKFPFAGTVHTIMDLAALATTRDAALGPVRSRVMGKFGIGTLPEGTNQTMSLGTIVGTIRFLLPAFLKRQYTPSPFFDAATGKPKVAPYVLTPAERDGLRKLCGPKPA